MNIKIVPFRKSCLWCEFLLPQTQWPVSEQTPGHCCWLEETPTLGHAIWWGAPRLVNLGNILERCVQVQAAIIILTWLSLVSLLVWSFSHLGLSSSPTLKDQGEDTLRRCISPLAARTAFLKDSVNELMIKYYHSYKSLCEMYQRICDQCVDPLLMRLCEGKNLIDPSLVFRLWGAEQ